MKKFAVWILVAALLASPVVVQARLIVNEIVKTAFTFRPQALIATGNGSAIDRLNYLSAIAVLDVGAVAGTTPTLNCKVQESDASAGTYTDISGAVFTQVTAANQREQVSVDLVGKKRYIRATCIVAGTGPSFTMSLILVLGEPGVFPLP